MAFRRRRGSIKRRRGGFKKRSRRGSFKKRRGGRGSLRLVVGNRM